MGAHEVAMMEEVDDAVVVGDEVGHVGAEGTVFGEGLGFGLFADGGDVSVWASVAARGEEEHGDDDVSLMEGGLAEFVGEEGEIEGVLVAFAGFHGGGADAEGVFFEEDGELAREKVAHEGDLGGGRAVVHEDDRGAAEIESGDALAGICGEDGGEGAVVVAVAREEKGEDGEVEGAKLFAEDGYALFEIPGEGACGAEEKGENGEVAVASGEGLAEGGLQRESGLAVEQGGGNLVAMEDAGGKDWLADAGGKESGHPPEVAVAIGAEGAVVGQEEHNGKLYGK